MSYVNEFKEYMNSHLGIRSEMYMAQKAIKELEEELAAKTEMLSLIVEEKTRLESELLEAKNTLVDACRITKKDYWYE